MPFVQPLLVAALGVSVQHARIGKLDAGPNEYVENAPGVGGYGGDCTCPDGTTYQVGDNYNSCGSLACFGGVSGTCNHRHGPWSNKKVTCAPPSGTPQAPSLMPQAPPSLPPTNEYVDAMTGGWGGDCTCPDGQIYQVGDNHDGCGSLACFGGKSGTCNKARGPWSGKKVTCA